MIENILKPAELIEKRIVDDNNRPIILQQWEKDVLNKVCVNKDIIKIWILTGRKSGATTLCKWLHWLRTDAKETYVFSHNMAYAKLIKNMPIIRNLIVDKDEYLDVFLGRQWMRPITLNKFINEVEEFNNYVTCQGLFDEKIDINYHFMYDTVNFNKLTYNTLMSFNPKLFTICLPYSEYDKVKDILEEDRKKDNVVIVADGDLSLWPEWWEESGLKEAYTSKEKIYKI